MPDNRHLFRTAGIIRYTSASNIIVFLLQACKLNKRNRPNFTILKMKCNGINPLHSFYSPHIMRRHMTTDSAISHIRTMRSLVACNACRDFTVYWMALCTLKLCMLCIAASQSLRYRIMAICTELPGCGFRILHTRRSMRIRMAIHTIISLYRTIMRFMTINALRLLTM